LPSWRSLPRGHPSRLARREQAAVVLAIAGLTLLALSLVDTTESDQRRRSSASSSGWRHAAPTRRC
jgi:hypothetical protein